MGGFGSGRRREVTWGTVESVRWIDINELVHAGLQWTGWSGLVQWPARAGRPAPAIRICADGDRVVLSYRVPDTGIESDVHDTISLVHLGCPFGDGRRYFECPGLAGRPCHRHVVRLYWVGRSFRCRHCHHLTYASRSETAEDRAHRRANKVRKRLGGAPGIARPFPDKPSGMWQETYTGLRGKAVAAEQRANNAAVEMYGMAPPPTTGARQDDETLALLLEQLRRVAFSDIGDFLDEKSAVKPLADLSPETASALHSYRTRADGSVYGIRLHNKIRALKVLSKHLGLLDPQ